MTFSQKRYRYNIHNIKIKLFDCACTCYMAPCPYKTNELSYEDEQYLREHLTRVFDFIIKRNGGGVRALDYQFRLLECMQRNKVNKLINNLSFRDQYLQLKYIASGENEEYEEWKKDKISKLITLMHYRLYYGHRQPTYICKVFFGSNMIIQTTVDVHPITSLLYLSMRYIIEHVKEKEDKFIHLYYLTTAQLKEMYKQIKDDLFYYRNRRNLNLIESYN